jgi:hypothetical protein
MAYPFASWVELSKIRDCGLLTGIGEGGAAFRGVRHHVLRRRSRRLRGGLGWLGLPPIGSSLQENLGRFLDGGISLAAFVSLNLPAVFLPQQISLDGTGQGLRATDCCSTVRAVPKTVFHTLLILTSLPAFPPARFHRASSFSSAAFGTVKCGRPSRSSQIGLALHTLSSGSRWFQLGSSYAHPRSQCADKL